MANKGSFIRVNQDYLVTGDYLVSNNGHFFAVLQGDGNFCVYRGTGPAPDNSSCYMWGSQALADGYNFFLIQQGDGNLCVYKGTGPSDNQGYVWGTQALADGGQFFAVMQDDGNFCVYKGTSPNDNRGYVWGTQVTDAVVDCTDIYKIDFDVANGTVLKTTPSNVYTTNVTNQTSTEQTSSISATYTVAETSGWSNALGTKVSVGTSFKTGIPVLAEGKINVSVEVSNTYTWNGSSTNSQSFSFGANVKAPANSTVRATVVVAMSTLRVPYTLSGTLIYRSGAHAPGQLNGMYEGTSSGDVNLTVTPVAGSALQSYSQPLKVENDSLLVTA